MFVYPKPPLKIALVGSYLPRHCGIATFSSYTVQALKNYRDPTPKEIAVAAINDTPQGYAYNSDVKLEILQENDADYRMAADFFNDEAFNGVILQHEYGIFGGRDAEGVHTGNKILLFAERLRIPLIVNLHTVLETPQLSQKRLLQNLIEYAQKVAVMSQKSQELLQSVYGIRKDKITIIHHGIQDYAFDDPEVYKQRLEIPNRKVILTLGLLSPSKGLEVMLKALPTVIKKHPDVLYLIVGALHPHVFRFSGRAYIDFLQGIIQELKLENHVQIIESFVEDDTFRTYLGAADIYALPYLNKDQASSGMLVNAMGAGKAVISTGFCQAEEFLANGRGLIADFNRPESFSQHINFLLENESEQRTIREKAYAFSRQMIWPEIVKKYMKLLSDTKPKKQFLHHPNRNVKPPSTEQILAFPVVLNHYHKLCDDVGILEHARYTTPRRDHGYCTDDNARALIMTLLCHHLGLGGIIKIADIQRHLSHLLHAFEAGKDHFKNRFYYKREWEDCPPNGATHGRAIWALGLGVAIGPPSIHVLCKELLHEGLAFLKKCHPFHTAALALLGINPYLKACPIDSIVKRHQKFTAEALFAYFAPVDGKKWMWPEKTITWGSGVAPWALMATGRHMNIKRYTTLGLRLLSWLVTHQQKQEGKRTFFNFIGNKGWFSQGAADYPYFDQQPIEAMHMIGACLEAYQATGERQWRDKATQSLQWFLGRNIWQLSLYDFQTGGCCDGLTIDGLNKNQGAESTLSWLLALLYYKWKYDASEDPKPTSLAASIKVTDLIPFSKRFEPMAGRD